MGLVFFLATGAMAEDEIGAHDPETGEWHLRDDAGTALPPFFFGDPDDVAFMGDWNGDGVDTPGLFRPSDAFVYLRNSNTQGIADILYFFGNPDDIPVAGDFNGNGFDTVSLYRPSEGKAYVINKLGSGSAGIGAAENSYVLSAPGVNLVPFAGDFNSDGVSTFGLYDPATANVHLWNDHTGGAPDVTFNYGNPLTDKIVFGDWDGNPTQTAGVKRAGTFYLRNTNATGSADETIAFGDSDWNPLSWQAVPSGTIQITKATTPGGATGFGFTDTVAAPNAFSLDDGQTKTFTGVTPGAYSVIENLTPTGTTLTGLTCVDSDAGGTASSGVVGTRTATINLDPGETVTCTFTNTTTPPPPPRGTITIIKDAVPDDPQDFAFTSSVAAHAAFDLDDDPGDVTLPNNRVMTGLLAGTYSVDETVPSGWDLTATCSDGSPVSAIVLSPGEDVTCTFVNTKRGTIEITKATVPAGGTGFGFTGNIGMANIFTLDHGQTQTFLDVVPGLYTVTEDDPTPGYDLTGLTCVDSDAGGIASTWDLGTRVSTINLDPGETVTCTFTNTERGSITIIKNAVPDDPQDFAFTSDVVGHAAFSLDDDADGTLSNTETMTDVVPGTYNVGEAVPAGWDLTSAICDDASPVTAIDLSPGEDVTCTFTNTKRGSITIVKDSAPDNPQDFTFTDDIEAPNTFDLDDDADGTLSNTKIFTNVVPGAYTVAESDITVLTAIGCSDGNSTGVVGTGIATVNVEPGESVTCTFTNTFNTPPTLDLDTGTGGNDFATTFTEDGGAVAITGTVDIADAEDANMASASVTITNVQDVGVEILQLNLVSCAPIVVGGNGTATVILTGPASIPTFEACLETATYENTSAAPTAAPARTVDFKVNDGTVDSLTRTTTVTVVPVNDPPLLTAPGPYDSIGNVGIDVSAGSGLLTAATITDDDYAGPFTIGGTVPTTTTNSGTLSINTSTGAFTYDPPPGFEGADTFDYQVCDGGTPLPSACSTAQTVTINVSDVIWFIDNTGGGSGGAGTLADPFKTIGNFNGSALDGPNDNIYLAETGTDYGTGIGMNLVGQTLIGEGATGSDLQTVLGISLPTHSNPLPAVGGFRPIIATTNANAVDLGTSNTIRGVDIGNTGTGIGMSGTSVGTLTVSDVAVSGTGRIINIPTSGTLNVTFDSLASTSSATSAAIDLNGVGGTFNVTGATTISGASSGGIDLSANSGTFTFSGGLDIDTTSGTGFNATGGGTVNVDSTAVATTIDTTTGIGVNISATTIGGTGVTFDSVNVNGAPSGILLASTGGGSFTASGGTIQNVTSRGVDLANVGGTVNIGASIHNTTGLSVEITGSSGTITFSGLIDENNQGINLSTNSGTFTFSGGMDIDTTGANIGFRAMTGGSVNICADTNCGAGGGTPVVNTVDTTAGTGTAVSIDGVTIGGSGATFQSIDVDGAPNGIVLNNTGAGAFAVTGTGGSCTIATPTCTGGRIQNTIGSDGGVPGSGIHLTTTGSASLSSMHLNDHPNFAIRGTDVTGFTLANSLIDGANGTSTAADEGGVSFDNLLGSALVDSSAISGGLEDNIVITNSSGTLNRLTVSSSVIGHNSTASGNDGILVESQGSATLNLSVLSSTFAGARGDMIQCNAIGNSTMDCVIQDNTFNNTHPNIVPGGGGITISGGGATASINMTYNVSGTGVAQTFRGSRGSAITANFVSGTGTAVGTIQNNEIGVIGVPGSGSLEGAGISVGAAQNVAHTLTIEGNIIREIDGFAGIDAAANMDVTMNATITNNDISLAAGPTGFAFAPMYLLVGGAGTETGTFCSAISNNTFNGSAGPFAGNAVVFDQISTSANHNLPGYFGSAQGEFAAPVGTASADIDTYLVTRGNSMTNGPAPSFPGGGVDAGIVSGVSGTGASCP